MPVAFDTSGMEQYDERTWFDPRSGDQVSLTYIGLVPDLPAGLDDLPLLRHRLAIETAEVGALIEAHVVFVDQVPTLFQLLKVPIPNQDSGQAFIAAFTLPKATCSAVLRIQCAEGSTTGVREATVFGQVGVENYLRPHPYAPEVTGRLPWHVADDTQWDGQFPDHPLSRARAWAHKTMSTARIDPGFAHLPPFRPTPPEPVRTPEPEVGPTATLPRNGHPVGNGRPAPAGPPTNGHQPGGASESSGRFEIVEPPSLVDSSGTFHPVEATADEPGPGSGPHAQPTMYTSSAGSAEPRRPSSGSWTVPPTDPPWPSRTNQPPPRGNPPSEPLRLVDPLPRPTPSAELPTFAPPPRLTPAEPLRTSPGEPFEPPEPMFAQRPAEPRPAEPFRQFAPPSADEPPPRSASTSARLRPVESFQSFDPPPPSAPAEPFPAFDSPPPDIPAEPLPTFDPLPAFDPPPADMPAEPLPRFGPPPEAEPPEDRPVRPVEQLPPFDLPPPPTGLHPNEPLPQFDLPSLPEPEDAPPAEPWPPAELVDPSPSFRSLSPVEAPTPAGWPADSPSIWQVPPTDPAPSPATNGSPGPKSSPVPRTTAPPATPAPQPTEPAATEPATTEPAAAEPPATEPAALEPDPIPTPDPDTPPTSDTSPDDLTAPPDDLTDADAPPGPPADPAPAPTTVSPPVASGDVMHTVLVGLPIGGYLPLWQNSEISYWRMTDPEVVRARIGVGLESRSEIDNRRFREAAMLSPDKHTLFLMDRYRDRTGHLGGTTTQLVPATEEEAHRAADDKAMSELYGWLGEVVLAAGERSEFVAVETGGWSVPASPMVLIMLRNEGDEWHSVVETSPVPVGAPVWRDQQPVDDDTQLLVSPATDQTMRAAGLLTRFAVATWSLHPFQLGLSFGPNPTLGEMSNR